MWGGGQPTGSGMMGIYGGGGVGGGQSSSNTSNQKHDIFVGNLAFNTTEEQLHTAFSEIGRVLNVRMVTDQETGKPRGFAFVEFEDPQAALSAIRNMNDYELNGRRLRVNFSNSSHLEALAGKLGMDLSQQTGKSSSSGGGGVGSSATSRAAAGRTGTNAVADALKGFSKGEMYDVIAKLKEIADRDPDEARRVISGHPQLPEALLFLMSKLDMVKTPLPTGAPTGLPTPTMAAATAAVPLRAADPRAAAAAAAPPRADPRQAAAVAAPPAAAVTRMDPRQQQQQRVDPRAAARGAPPPPPPPPPRAMPAAAYAAPAAPPPGSGSSGVAHLDPALVQQVMSLTPQQIQQLPPDGQQNILQLRQQIMGSRQANF